MKMFSRRKATVAITGAPIGFAATVGRGGGSTLDATFPPSPMHDILKPAGLDKYYETVQKAASARQFFDQRRELLRYRHDAFSPNIACLKSVAMQHKIIMHMREVDRLVDEHKSFVEKMMDAFGVREYFKKMEKYHGEGAQTASNRY